MADTDVIVIGGGPGGYVAALKLAMNGKKTILIEKEQVGGTCLNRGCIPTKALIHCTEVLDAVKNSGTTGILIDEFHVDTGKMNDYKNSVVQKLVQGVSYLLSKRGVKVIQGTASFIGNHLIEVTQNDGKKQQLTAEDIVIATGSESSKIPIEGIDGKNVISSTEALDITSLPTSLAIIGGGVIGMEIGTTYAKLGVDVTVLEALPSILPALDREIAEEFLKHARSLMKITTGAKVKSISDVEDKKRIVYETEGKNLEILAEKVLLCVGRRPNTKNLGLENTDVKLSERGYILTDDECKTSAEGIYAIGDVNGKTLLAHAASAQAIVAAESVCGKKSDLNTKLIPSCIYTKPEIACVGKTEEELKKNGISYNVGKFPLKANGRALSINEPDGFIKILTGKKYGEILGAHMVGTRVTDLIAEIALAMNTECTVDEIVATVHAHPTVAEAVFEAAELAAFGQTIHMV